MTTSKFSELAATDKIATGTAISPYINPTLSTPSQTASYTTSLDATKALLASVGLLTLTPTAQFKPSDLGSRLKIWYHFDPAYLFTDAALASRATAASTVYTLQALTGSNGVQATEANKPTLLEESGKVYGRFASTDNLTIGSVTQTYPAYIYIALRTGASLAGNQLLLERANDGN